MKVVEAKEFGGPEVLVVSEVPEPVAGPGQVVVAVAYADTLFVDTQIRSGWGRDFFPVRPPYVPGGAVAGRVRKVGDGVDPRWIGRRVAAYTGELEGHGGYAEQVAVPVEALVPVPDGLELRDAAALIHDGVTGMGIFEAAEVRAGEDVLVIGATGGMGVLLVQLVRAAGARVIAVARGVRKLELARELGADVAVDSSVDGWAERVREATGGTGPGLVLDGVGGDVGRAAFEIIAPGGRFSAHGAPAGEFAGIAPEEAAARGVTLRGIGDVQYGMDERRRLAVAAMEAALRGEVRPVVGQTFPLAEAAAAHAAIESRAVVGKTLLKV